MPPNTCEFKVGRLMEIRVAAGYRTVGDVDEMIQMMVDRGSKLAANAKYIIAADWRKVTADARSVPATLRVFGSDGPLGSVLADLRAEELKRLDGAHGVIALAYGRACLINKRRSRP